MRIVTKRTRGGPARHGAEPSALARARALYNAADYDDAIEAAAQARTQPGAADAAALVSGSRCGPKQSRSGIPALRRPRRHRDRRRADLKVRLYGA